MSKKTVKVTAIKPFSSTAVGNISAEQEFECELGYAQHLQEAGLVKGAPKKAAKKPANK